MEPRSKIQRDDASLGHTFPLALSIYWDLRSHRPETSMNASVDLWSESSVDQGMCEQ